LDNKESSHLSFAARPYYTETTLRITMPGPFDFSMITEEHPYYAHLLRNAISQLGALPDFSEDSRVAVYSDFGGEHKGAHFNTYSFLIIADNKIGPFIEAIKELRQRHGILDQYSEFAFKDLDYGPRLRALPEFLHIVDTLLHGAIVTIAIDKIVPTVFGPHKKEAHAAISTLLAQEGLGSWDGATGEKVLRVCHA
jgi:hypothetical protein